MKTFLKRDVLVEFDREITKKVTQFTGDEHYVVAIVDETKSFVFKLHQFL